MGCYGCGGYDGTAAPVVIVPTDPGRGSSPPAAAPAEKTIWHVAPAESSEVLYFSGNSEAIIDLDVANSTAGDRYIHEPR